VAHCELEHTRAWRRRAARRPLRPHRSRAPQVTFADEACTPALARFAHAAAPIHAFEALGEVRLQARRAAPGCPRCAAATGQ